jgi:SAM-dependent methyltransferase
MIAIGLHYTRPASAHLTGELMTDYGQIRAELLVAYGPAGARHRDEQGKPDWKLAERAAFLGRLQHEGCRSLLEIGAGTGQDSLYFAAAGLDVTATDLSPDMVASCQAKGLRAEVMDFSRPQFAAGSFDAVYAMNCLLHVPNSELPTVLPAIRQLMRPGGLFFVGVYGGKGEEGSMRGDDHMPPRFFSWRTDQQIQDLARPVFEIVDFHVVKTGSDFHGFQSLTLRRPEEGAPPAAAGMPSAAGG